MIVECQWKKNSLEGSVLTPEPVIYRWYFHKNTFCGWTPRIADRMARVPGKKHLYFAPAFCSSWNNKEEEEEENELKDESNRDDREFFPWTGSVIVKSSVSVHVWIFRG